jgi:F plasmid transfer operon, TraF, protein
MKYKVKLAALSAMLCANAIADPVYLPPAQNLTYGNSSNNQSIMSSITNPAAAAAQLGNEDSQFRFGILSSIGAGYEFGNVGRLYNTIDNTKNTIASPITTTDLQNMYVAAGCTTSCTAPQQTAFINNVVTAINTSTAVTTANTVLSQLQQDGNVSVYGDVHVPLTPFVVTKKGLGGSIVLDANVSAIANMTFIADPLAISSADATTIANNYAAYVAGGSSGTFNGYPAIANDSTLLVKAAMVEEIGLGYSRPMLKRETGDLTAGVRAKYYKVKLVRDAQKLDTSNGSQNTFNASKSYTSSSGVGLDVGTLWTAKRYRLGAWVNNLNTPSFKYNSITAADLTAAGYTNSAIISQLTADETYKMKPQLEMEGAFYSESQNWVLNAGLDGNAVPDPVGRDFQWATLSAAYATNSWWIPGIRLGYRTNLAGSKLSYTTAGLTLLKALSLDVAYGMDSITDKNGKKIPRSAMITLGIQMTF